MSTIFFSPDGDFSVSASPRHSWDPDTHTSQPFPWPPDGISPSSCASPKEVGIGMRIGDAVCPHAVGLDIMLPSDRTGLAKGGAAAECGLIAESDTYVRPRPPRPAPKLVGVGLILDITKKKDGTLVHIVDGLSPDGAAAESGRIAVNDRLLAVNGKDSSTLDGKQLSTLIVGPEGSSVKLEFLSECIKNRELVPSTASSQALSFERYEVVLIRGGCACKKKLEDDELADQKLMEQYDRLSPELFEVKLFRGESEGKLRVQAELEAHRKHVERVEEENVPAEAAYMEKLLLTELPLHAALCQRQNSLQAQCDIEDARIAQEATTSELLRKNIALLQENLEKADAEAKAAAEPKEKAEAEAKAAAEKAAAEKAVAEKAAAEREVRIDSKHHGILEAAAKAKMAAEAKATVEEEAQFQSLFLELVMPQSQPPPLQSSRSAGTPQPQPTLLINGTPQRAVTPQPQPPLHETGLKTDEEDLGNHRVVGPKEPSNHVSRPDVCLKEKHDTTSLRRSANSQDERSLSPNKRATSQGESNPSSTPKHAVSPHPHQFPWIAQNSQKQIGNTPAVSAGIGIAFGRTDQSDQNSALFILQLNPNGPAARTGRLEPMQELISIDDWPVHGQDIPTVTQRFEGIAGTPVTLQVLTLASKGRLFLDVQVIREQITVNGAPILNAAPIPNTINAGPIPHSAQDGVHVQPMFVSHPAQAVAEEKAAAEAKASAEDEALNTKIKEQKNEIDKLKLRLETANTCRRDVLAVRVADLQQLKTALQTEIETLEAALQCMRRKFDEQEGSWGINI